MEVEIYSHLQVSMLHLNETYLVVKLLASLSISTYGLELGIALTILKFSFSNGRKTWTTDMGTEEFSNLTCCLMISQNTRIWRMARGDPDIEHT